MFDAEDIHVVNFSDNIAALNTGVCGAGMSCAVVVDAQPTATRRYVKSNRNRVRGIGILVIASLSSKAI